jgi:hypothetical protein
VLTNTRDARTRASSRKKLPARLEAARAHLNALGAPEPSDLPPYDESKYEPMPDVETDPPDLPVESNPTGE